MIRCQRGPRNVAKLKRERAQVFAVWKVACRGGPDRVGLASVFSGPSEGIATRSYVNPSGYWLLRSPNGIVTVQRQTDWGPATFTGREFDLTAAAAGDHGYGYGSFPTDRGTWTGRFIGYRIPRGLRGGACGCRADNRGRKCSPETSEEAPAFRHGEELEERFAGHAARL